MADDHISTDDSDSESNNAELTGVLSKWTNYIHGWQDRYIVLKNGTLSYYKSEHDQGFGCRGAISIFKANIKPHEFDECRFDVSVNDSVWYLRAESVEDKQRWVDALESHKAESGYGTGSENSLKRHGSTVSLQSTTLSTASGGSFKRSCRGLKEKLAEMETFKDILCRQIDTLQHYFDTCAERSGRKQDVASDLPVVDFKGEAITFRATTAGVLETLAHCIDLVSQREESWRKRLEREVDRRRKAESLAKTTLEQLQIIRTTHPGPDLEEGPHSTLQDDEFYDAVESGLDKVDEECEFRERLKSNKSLTPKPSISQVNMHPLWTEIEQVVNEQVAFARLGVGEIGPGSSDSTWQLFAEDGEMRMYRREVEFDGMVVDPLKACHVVKGVTGREVCHYFFRPEFRYDWEATLEQMTVLETISEDTLIFLQTHKRIWPASQRDCVFWSHMRSISDDQDKDGPDMWTVCNHSTEHTEHPANSGKCVRIFLTVCLLCQTRIDPPKDGTPITRDNISCRITYCSVVNPGGWAPASVLRAVYKREYPKFLKRFTGYVINQCKEQPIMF